MLCCTRGFSGDLPVDFTHYQKFLKLVKDAFKESAKSEEKAKIIKRLVYKVEVGLDSIKIHYYAGQGFLGTLEESFKNLEKKCSHSLTSGAPERI